MKKLLLFLIPIFFFGFITNSYSQEDDKLVILHTQSGDIIIELFPNDAPKHVENFVKLADEGFYDRTIFHRIISGFMIQGGDPLTKPGAYENTQQWGTGDPGYSINAEFNDIKHNRGIVSMARSMDPNSAGSQFFIVHQNSNFLDGQYTVFGRIVTQESFDVLDTIATLKTEPNTNIAFDWGKGEILSTEVVNRSDVPNLLDLGPPERMSAPSTEMIGGEYTNDDLGFSFTAPEGWIVQEPPKTSQNVPDVVSVGPTVNNFSPAISVSVTDTNGDSLQDKINKVKGALQNSIDSGGIEILSEENTKIHGHDAHVLDILGVFVTEQGAQSVKFKESTISTSEKFFTITYTNTEENFENDLYRYESVIDSFTILSDDSIINQNQDDMAETNGVENGGGCLIATAAYGSELAPQVQMLRELRDNTVLSTTSGTSFMTGFNQFYYTFSPTIADWERENPVFQQAVKVTITPLLTSLSILSYVDIDSEAEMLGYGIGIILMNIGMYFIAPAIVIHRLLVRK